MIRIKRKVIDCLCNWTTCDMPGFLFGDAKVSKKKDAMLMLSFCLFSKEKLYIRSVRWGSVIHGVSNRWYFWGPGKSWSVKDLPKTKHKIIDKMNKLII